MTYKHIKVECLTPTIGAVISGIDLSSELASTVYEEIKQALYAHHVVFLRDQPINADALLKLGNAFGEMETHEFFPHVTDYPQIQVLSHEGDSRPETDRWHTDVTFREEPSCVTILQAMEIPTNGGGDTLWASSAAAFESLGPEIQTMLLGLRAAHDLPWSFRLHENYKTIANKRNEAGPSSKIDPLDLELRMIPDNPTMIHPAVINHPVTKRLTLFVNSIWTKRLEGLHPDLSDAILRMLFEWIKKPEFCCRFQWQAGAIAIWDNYATQHYATFDYAPHYREMRRMTCGVATPELLTEHIPAHLQSLASDTHLNQVALAS